MTGEERQRLLEAAATAFREHDPSGRVLPSPAWHDLPPADREEAYECQLASRRLERMVDPDGLSTTAREVLSRIGALGQLQG